MNVAITNFQINSSELAKDAIQNVPKEARDFNTYPQYFTIHL